MKTAILFEGLGADPCRDRMVFRDGAKEVHVIALENTNQAARIARDLVEDGFSPIQLCGGMPAKVLAEVGSIVGERAAVSAVLFGIESIEPAARYSSAFSEGTPPPEAFIVVMPNWQHQAEFTKRLPPQQTSILIVGDEDRAVAAAARVVNDGVGLVEIYGTCSTDGVVRIIEAVDGRAAVGASMYSSA